MQLPRTLGLTKGQLNAPITVAIYGFLESQKDLPLDCTLAPKVKNADDPNLTDAEKATSARILRRTVQPYIDGQILYIPMPLRYACFDVPCEGADQTCKAGKCVLAGADPSSRYRDGYANGDASTCFRSRDCMFGAGAAPMTVVDASLCQYRVTGGSPDHMNVMMAFDEFVVEVLDEDRDEGFFFPDPVNKPDVIQLAAGLCDKTLNRPHPILSVVASTTCPPKSVFQPVCNDGAIALTPATSSVYVLIDPAIGGDSWSKPSGTDTKSLKEQIESALALPSFSNTNVIVEVLPQSPTGTPGCGGPTKTAAGRITTVYKDLTDNVLNLSAGAAHASIPTALARVYNAAQTNGFPSTQNVKAVVILTNGDPESLQGCPTTTNTSQGFATQLAALGVKTYVIPTEKNPAVYPANAINNIIAVATAGGTLLAGDSATNILSKGAVYGGLVVSNLSSCLYNRPGHITNVPTPAALSFVPSDGGLPDIKNLGIGQCKAGDDGWYINGEFIQICGNSCERVKTATTAFLGIYTSVNDPSAYLQPQTIVWATQEKKPD